MFRNHITKPAGTNAPGVGNVIKVAPLAWIDTLAVPSGSNPGDSVLITGNHTFLTATPTYGFVNLYTTPRSGKANDKQVGDIDSYGIDSTFEARSPGINYALAEFMAEQDEFIVLVPDINCITPRYKQYGTLCSPCLKRDWEWMSGTAGGSDYKGFTIKFDAYNDRPLWYTGTVTLAEQP